MDKFDICYIVVCVCSLIVLKYITKGVDKSD